MRVVKLLAERGKVVLMWDRTGSQRERMSWGKEEGEDWRTTQDMKNPPMPLVMLGKRGKGVEGGRRKA